MIGVFIAKKTIADSFEALNQHNLSKFMSAWRDGVKWCRYESRIAQD